MPEGGMMLPRPAVLCALFLIMILPGVGLFIEGAMTMTSMIASLIAFFLFVNVYIEPKIG
jgi:hypothetical protein